MAAISSSLTKGTNIGGPVGAWRQFMIRRLRSWTASAYGLLGAQVMDLCGQPFGFLAQSQRGGQEPLGRHALPAQVVPQPGLAGIRFAPVRERLTGPGQIIEHTSFFRLHDLLINP